MNKYDKQMELVQTLGLKRVLGISARHSGLTGKYDSISPEAGFFMTRPEPEPDENAKN